MANTYPTTQYPLGSTQPKVLYNNASNLDDWLNTQVYSSLPDRFGVQRQTWFGIEQAANNALINTGYEFIGDYDADGPLTITALNQVFSKDGEFWRAAPPPPGPGPTLPYTTVNNWVVDQPKFVSAGDAVLRSDLANPSYGAQLVAYETGQTVKQKLDQMSVARIDLVSEYGLIDGDAGNAAKVQNAFNTAPIGCTLVFPPWVIATAVPLTVNRLMNLDLDRCTIRGDFIAGDLSSDVLRIAITDAGPSVGDARMMIIRGGRVFNHMGGNCALNVNPAGATGLLPQFGLIITEGAWGGFARAIRIGGVNPAGDTNFCTIMGNDLSGIGVGADSVIDIDHCADGHRVLNNLIHGYGTGVRVNVVEGAYQTLIMGNGIVSRDGALLISNGARVMFLYNQCEQPLSGNALVPKATVLIQGLDYISHGCVIYGNNFGGGAYVDFNIAMYNAQGCLVDCNYFFPANVDDILLGNSGTAAAKYNTIGGNNWARGARAILSAPCDASRRLSVAVQADTQGNRGVWRGDAGYSGGWGSVGFEFMLDGFNVLHFEGAVDGGAATTGTLICDLPIGYWPKTTCYLPFVTELGTFGSVVMGNDGKLAVGIIPASPNQRIELGHASFNVVFPALYDPGA